MVHLESGLPWVEATDNTDDQGRCFRSGEGGFECAMPDGGSGAFDLYASNAMAYPVRQRMPRCQRVGAHGAFPHDRNAPAGRSQGGHGAFVPRPVQAQLLFPEFRPGLGEAKEGATGMAVPEAPMNEDYGIPAFEDHVGPTGHTTGVKPVSEPCLPEVLAHPHFRAGVLAPDA